MINAENTPFVPTRDDLIGYISDTYKEINGFRPRYDWSTFTYNELDNWGRKLSKEAEVYRKDRAREERVLRKLRHAREVMWARKRKTYFTPASFTLALVIDM